MVRLLSNLCLLIVLLKESSGSISEEKCKEYSERFINDKISISRPAGRIKKIKTEYGEIPHAVALGYGECGIGIPDDDIVWGDCGASLISEQFVLTSASCTGLYFRGLSCPVIRARIGVHNLTKIRDNPLAQDFTIVERYVHPQFQKSYLYSDLALLKLNKRAIFSKFVRPACLFNSFDLPINIEISSIGWGEGHQGHNSTLQKVYFDLFSNEECNKTDIRKRYPVHGILDKLFICTGGRRASKDTCYNDNGNPLHIFNRDDNTYEIVGINSLDDMKLTCGTFVGPTRIQTRIAAYIPWIESIVWPCDENENSQTPEDLNEYIVQFGAPPKMAPCGHKLPKYKHIKGIHYTIVTDEDCL